jgi:hypothetical protein
VKETFDLSLEDKSRMFSTNSRAVGNKKYIGYMNEEKNY